MAQILGINGPAGCGGTFLDWSLNYLCGHDKTYFIRFEKNKLAEEYERDLVADPVRENNAHKHKAVHPLRAGSLPVLIPKLENTKNDFATFFLAEVVDHDKQINIQRHVAESYPHVKFIMYTFGETATDFIFVSKNDRVGVPAENILNTTDICNPWEERDSLALRYMDVVESQNTYDVSGLDNVITLSMDNIIASSLYSEILKIFEWAGMTLCNERIDHWKDVHGAWLKSCDVEFFTNIDYIVDCIINNVDYDLEQHRMTLAKEIVIMNKLLFKHNLNIKHFGFDQLPNNTLDWHSLLEENTIHDI